MQRSQTAGLAPEWRVILVQKFEQKTENPLFAAGPPLAKSREPTEVAGFRCSRNRGAGGISLASREIEPCQSVFK
jgi:hypothetical protein